MSNVTSETNESTRSRRSLRGDDMQEDPPAWVLESAPESKLNPLWLQWWAYTKLKGWNQPGIPVPAQHLFYGSEIKNSIQHIRDIKHLDLSGIVTVGSVKGGCSKTTTASWLAYYVSVYLDVMVIIFDADTGNAATGRRLRSPRKSDKMTASQMADAILKHGWEPTAEDIHKHVQFDERSHAYVLPDFKRYNITPEEMVKVATTLKKACYLLIFDTAPGSKEEATTGAFAAASVPMVSALFHSLDDLSAVGQAVNYDTEASEEEKAEMLQPGSDQYGLRERINRDEDVLLVFQAVPLARLNPLTQYKLAERYAVRPENILLIPYSKYIYNANPVDPDRVTSRVVASQMSLARRWADTSRDWNRRYPGETPEYLESMLEASPQVEQSQPEDTPEVTPVDSESVETTDDCLPAVEPGPEEQQAVTEKVVIPPGLDTVADRFRSAAESEGLVFDFVTRD